MFIQNFFLAYADVTTDGKLKNIKLIFYLLKIPILAPAPTDPPFKLSMLSDEDFTEFIAGLQNIVDGYKSSLPNLTDDDKIQIADTIKTVQDLLTEPDLSANVISGMTGILTSLQNLLSPPS